MPTAKGLRPEAGGWKMTRSDSGAAGSVASLWRYPVKSMLGEQVTTASVDEWGLFGDRAYAVVDRTEGKVASAKNPRKWPRMFEFRAVLPHPAKPDTPVSITLPDGTALSSDQADVDEILSGVLGRPVTLRATERARHEAADPRGQKPSAAQAEEYWPDMEGLDYRNTVTDFDMPEGTFFDCAVVHLLTTATLARLGELHPQGRFEIPRFRPTWSWSRPRGRRTSSRTRGSGGPCGSGTPSGWRSPNRVPAA